MGLRCSLFGHAYGEPVTERDRERRGDEEVVTVRELRTCKRCGVDKVLSENTEVRHLDTAPTDSDSGTPVERDGATTETEDRAGSDAAGEDVDVSELVEAAESDQSVPAGTDDQPTSGTDSASTEPEASETTASEAAASETDESTPAADETPAEEEGGIIMEEGSEDEKGSLSDTEETTETSPDSDSDTTVPDQAEPEQVVPAEDRPEDKTDEKSEGVILGEDSATDESTGDRSETADSSAEASSGIDAVDDIEELEADADKPADSTASPAEPESMFGSGGGSQSASDTAAEDGHATPEERDPADSKPTTDDWKEPLETESETSSAEWDDPSFQFQSEPEERDEPETGPQRGPAGIASDGPIEFDADSDTVPGTLFCPDCGFTETAQSSLRAGDICPECHRGYLAGRQ